jgi:diguanylate cyclase (GGDEF)-like protein/PAS domain S-box-containing protein
LPKGVRKAIAATRAALLAFALFSLASAAALAGVPAQASPGESPAPAAAAARADTLVRHPLELRALIEPEAVLREVGADIVGAQLAGDLEQVALLQLAKANACRVVADWACQLEAGREAQQAAREAGSPHLEVRGLIAESRARMAVKDYTRGTGLLEDARDLLAKSPQAELQADVMLAYSSLSFSLGNLALSAEYSQRGLDALAQGEGLAMSARLLRNRARAEAGLGEVEAAKKSIEQAMGLARTLQDPKLEAELYLEGARVARLVGDLATQRRNGQRVVEMGTRLSSTQLEGLGHEVLGLAAADAGDGPGAIRSLSAAQASFAKLQLQSDELRAVRQLATVLLRFEPGSPQVAPAFQRYLALDAAISQSQRAEATGEFEARIKYAERENELLRLQAESAVAKEREQALARANRLNRALLGLGLAVLAVLVLFFLAKHRSSRRLAALLAQLGQSELQYRTLADNASDLVIRMRPDGARLYVSPSARERLGRDPAELLEQRWEQVHGDDLPALERSLASLVSLGDAVTVLFRIRHGQGHFIWIEMLARRVAGADGSDEIICACRDVSTRVRAEAALASTQSRLRAVTDNIPALISHVDANERYTFANSVSHALFGTTDADVIGRTVREVRGEAIYSQIREQVAAALSGTAVSFDGESQVQGRTYHYQTSYVPDVAADGTRSGFFSFTYDITRLKDAEQRLEQLARFDALTGLANRRYFDERMAATVARCKRQGAPLALLYMDMDFFKRVNDAHGHTGGDEVLRAFAARLTSCVREGDLAARIGGDEFVLLIEGAATRDNAAAVAAKLLELMARPVEAGGLQMPADCSIGIAWSAASAQAERLLAAADGALYEAKSAGRGRSYLVELP